MKHLHDDVIKWKHFPRYWPFVRGIHRSPVNSPHKGQWRGVLMFFFICAYTNGWVNNREAGDRAHCDVIVMDIGCWYPIMLSKSVILLTASNLIRIQGTCHRILSIWWKNNDERSHVTRMREQHMEFLLSVQSQLGVGGTEVPFVHFVKIAVRDTIYFAVFACSGHYNLNSVNHIRIWQVPAQLSQVRYGD